MCSFAFQISMYVWMLFSVVLSLEATLPGKSSRTHGRYAFSSSWRSACSRNKALMPPHRLMSKGDPNCPSPWQDLIGCTMWTALPLLSLSVLRCYGIPLRSYTKHNLWGSLSVLVDDMCNRWASNVIQEWLWMHRDQFIIFAFPDVNIHGHFRWRRYDATAMSS